jgi:hypothetical protein
MNQNILQGEDASACDNGGSDPGKLTLVNDLLRIDENTSFPLNSKKLDNPRRNLFDKKMGWHR